MLHRTKLKASLAGLAIAAGAASAAVLIPAGPAVGQSSPPLQLAIHLDSPATLTARGAGAEVSVTTICSGASSASVQVSLTIRSGSGIAEASGSTTVACVNQTDIVTVVAAPGKVLKKGTAITTGFIQACTPDFSSCSQAQDQETIILQ